MKGGRHQRKSGDKFFSDTKSAKYLIVQIVLQ